VPRRDDSNRRGRKREDPSRGPRAVSGRGRRRRRGG
jgi:hypothetical protein